MRPLMRPHSICGDNLHFIDQFESIVLLKRYHVDVLHHHSMSFGARIDSLDPRVVPVYIGPLGR